MDYCEGSSNYFSPSTIKPENPRICLIIASVKMFLWWALKLLLRILKILIRPLVLYNKFLETKKGKLFAIINLTFLVYNYYYNPTELELQYRQQALTMRGFMNLSTDPCGDFYKFTCGGKQTQELVHYPFSPWSTKVWNPFAKYAYEMLSSPPEPSDWLPVKQAKGLFADCLDTDTFEKEGVQPILDVLSKYGGWPAVTKNWNPKHFHLAELIGDANTIYSRFLKQNGLILKIFIQADIYDGVTKLIHIDQPKFSLSKSILLNPVKYPAQITAYKEFFLSVAKTFSTHEKLNLTESFKEYNQSSKDLQVEFMNMLAFEAKLVNISSMSEADHSNTFKKIQLNLFQFITDFWSPHAKDFINWRDLLQIFLKSGGNSDVKLYPDQVLMIINADYPEKVLELLATTDTYTVANYCMWRLVAALLPYTTKEMRQLTWKWEQTVNENVSQDSFTKEALCLQEILEDSMLGALITLKFVTNVLTKEAKAEGDLMTENIRRTFLANLNNNKFNWLDAHSQSVVNDKIKAVTPFIGYPNWYLDTSRVNSHFAWLTLDYVKSKYLQSVINISTRMSLSCRGIRNFDVKTAERPLSEWGQTGYYSEQHNSIHISSWCILSSQFTSMGPKYINYGALGSIIGHELGHAVNIPHRVHVNNVGELCWVPNFGNSTEKKECFVAQYNQFKTPDGHVDGQRTYNENIADSFGLNQAFAAYQDWIKEGNEGTEEARLPGLEQFTPQQMFFISFAMNWCKNPSLVMYDKGRDFHSPPEFRVIGAVQNSKDFAKSFNCPSGSPMNPHFEEKNRCSLW